MNAANALITLQDARTFLRPYVDNGTCNPDILDARIAEAEQRLSVKADWRMAVRRVRVLIRNQHFVLPPNVTRIMAATVDSMPAHVFSPLYEFMAVGPGDLDTLPASALGRNVVDAGEFPTQFDVPILCVDGESTDWRRPFLSGFYLMAFAMHADDTATPLTVRGFDEHNDEIRTGDAPGCTVPIIRWGGGVEGRILGMPAALPKSASAYRQVSQVYKAATRGPVYLYAYDASTTAMYLLSKMGPEETVPAYRRYRATGVAAPRCELQTTGEVRIIQDCASALLLVKVGWTRATRATDVLYIQNLPALKLMVMAIANENAGAAEKAEFQEMKAFKLLLDEKADKEGTTTAPLIVDMEPLLSGASLNQANRTL